MSVSVCVHVCVSGWADAQIVDVFKIESQPSTYLANVLIDDSTVITYITFNKGGTWQPLKKPANSMFVCRIHRDTDKKDAHRMTTTSTQILSVGCI